MARNEISKIRVLVDVPASGLVGGADSFLFAQQGLVRRGGSVISPEKSDMEGTYGKDVTAKTILAADNARAPAEVRVFPNTAGSVLDAHRQVMALIKTIN